LDPTVFRDFDPAVRIRDLAGRQLSKFPRGGLRNWGRLH
jgi:hypothetical protein